YYRLSIRLPKETACPTFRHNAGCSLKTSRAESQERSRDQKPLPCPNLLSRSCQSSSTFPLLPVPSLPTSFSVLLELRDQGVDPAGAYDGTCCTGRDPVNWFRVSPVDLYLRTNV
ncbi:hypothetical protein BaRGS_00036886, partial [Batillaria attramentaria]